MLQPVSSLALFRVTCSLRFTHDISIMHGRSANGLSGDYPWRTFTDKCSPASLGTQQSKGWCKHAPAFNFYTHLYNFL